jgi:EAL domain-containing protein (putative c-di-GMP-specific phosphodiesterase class I)
MSQYVGHPSAQFDIYISYNIQSTGADPSQICIELTESLLIDDLGVSAARLAGLKSLGVRLAIDDFGTGYSTFGYLQHLPVDLLKIDRVFVSRLGNDSEHAMWAPSSASHVHSGSVPWPKGSRRRTTRDCSSSSDASRHRGSTTRCRSPRGT